MCLCLRWVQKGLYITSKKLFCHCMMNYRFGESEWQLRWPAVLNQQFIWLRFGREIIHPKKLLRKVWESPKIFQEFLPRELFLKETISQERQLILLKESTAILS